MAKYISNRQQNIKIGIVSYTEDKTVLEVTGKVGIGTTNATSKLHVIGDARVTGVVTASSFRGDGSQLTGVTGTQIVTQDSISTPVFLTFANNIGVTSLGVATTGSNVLSVIPSLGNLGIGTTNAQQKLWVEGNGYFTGILTANRIFSSQYGEFVGGSISGTSVVGTSLSISGISTLGVTSTTNLTSQQLNVSGITTLGVTSTTNLTSQQLNVSGITTLGVTSTTNLTSQQLNVSGITTLGVTSATNLTSQQLNVSGITTLGVTSTTNLTSQQLNVSGISTFTNGPVLIGGGTSTGTAGQVLQVTGINSSVYIGGNLGIGTTNATSKLHVIGDVRVSGAITATTFVGALTGIATFATNAGIATYATNAGISTFATNAGIATFATNAGISTFATNAGIATFATNAGIATFATNAGISTNVIGGIASVTQLNVSGVSTLGTVKISSGIITATTGIVTYFGDGSQLTGVTGTQVVSQPFTSTPVFPILASNSGVSSVGIATTGPNALVFIPSSGNLGIGTTNPTSKLTVQGDVLVSGASTLGTVQISSGIVTATTGIVTYYGDGSKLTGISASSIVGVTSFATNAGIATNLKGGLVGNVPYQSATDTTVFLTNGSSGTILQSNGIGNAPSWVSAAPAAAITGLTIRDEGTIVGSANIVSELNFVGAIVSATSSAGIATITFLDYVSNAGIATFATNAGIATFATNAGISTFATNAGISTFATNAGISTFATNAGIATFATNAGIATFATNAGISTNVIGGIASVTQLNVSGVSTLGTVKISSGIITATTGIVTYFGDGSNLQGIQASSIVGVTSFATNAGIATFATNAGIATFATTAGIATFATTAGIATNVIGGIASVTQLNVSGVSTLGIVTSSQLYVSGVVTASQYFGDGSQLTGVTGVQIVTQDPISTPVFLTFANNAGVSTLGVVTTGSNSLVFIPSTGNLGIGTTNPTSKLDVRGDVLVSGVSTLGTVKISSGIITASSGIVTYFGDGSNLQGIQASSIVGVTSFATNAGIATFTSEWILGEVGSSDYTFTGPGFTGAESDPVLYLVRGQQYKFTNTMGAHPFRIQSTPNGSAGTQYNDGIVNNNVSNGTLTWNVQFDAPGLLYYQCTAHGSMGGKIYIIDAGIGPDVSVNTTGIITAASFSGNASSATFATTAGVSTSVIGGIGSITQLQVTGVSTFTNGPVLIGSATSTGTASQPLQVTGGAYVSSNLGIGTTNPQQKLWVEGNGYFTGILTANRIFSSQYGEFVGGSISGTSVVGTSLSISGISTLGTVKISSGIITATSGVVTYYGDGRYLDLTNNSRLGIGSTFTSGAVNGNLFYHIDYGKIFVYYDEVALGIGTDAFWVDAAPFNVGIITSLTNVSFSSGSAISPSMFFVGNNQTGFFSPGSGQFTVVSSGSSILNINPSGVVVTGVTTSTKVRVGTASTFTEDLVVNGSARVVGILTIGSSSITLNGTSNIINVGTGITINGNTGIVSATSFFGDGSGLTGAGSTVFNNTTTNQEFFPLFTATTSGTITASGISTSKLTYNPSTGAMTAVDFNSTSDINLKENIHTVGNALEITEQLRGVSFDWKETGRSSYGVIAQELEEVLPELVKNGEVKSVNYNGIIGVLIEAIKELKKEVEDLKETKYR